MDRVYRFDFKRLDVYDAAVRFFDWTVQVTADMPWQYRRVSDQVLGASLSILGNIGESGGRISQPGEVLQPFRYAQGSTHESAAYLDALAGLGLVDQATYNGKEEELARIGSMLTALMRVHQRRR